MEIIYEQLTQKFCKVVYKENAVDTHSKIIFATLTGYDDEFLIFKFEDDKTKMLNRKIVESISER